MKYPLGQLLLVVTILLCIDITDTEAQSGGFIAFSSTRDGNEEIYVIHQDGSQETNITRNNARDWHPSWSADGTKITFVSDRSGNAELYIMDANGQNLVNVSMSPNSEELAPEWSPDGTKIVFLSDRDGAYDLYTIEVASRTVERLTQDGLEKGAPAWFPDSKQVAYWAFTDGQPTLYSVDIIEKTRRVLTDQPGDSWPTISNNGSYMAFERVVGENKQIALLNLNALDNITLFTSGANHAQPAWANDNQRLAVVSDRDDGAEIYIVSLDGGIRRLTNSAESNLAPAWQPVPAPITFVEAFSLGLSFQRVRGNINPEAVRSLGQSVARLVPEAPYSVAPEQVFTVRVEVEMNPDGTVTVIPTPGSPTNVGRVSLEAYTYMRAQLVGLDVDKFDISPSPTEDPYMLRLLPNEINFWEWQMRPRPSAVGRTNYLAVKFFLPERSQDGAIIVEEGDGFLTFEVLVGAGTTPMLTQTSVARQNMRLYIDESKSLTLELDEANVVNRIGVRTSRGEGWFDLDFGLSGVNLLPHTCLMYTRDGLVPEPDFPATCNTETSIKLSIPYGDVFWWDFRTGQTASPIVVLGGSQVICQDNTAICEF